MVMGLSPCSLHAVLDDSIEADSIAKSDDTQTSRKDATDSASDKAQSANKAGTYTLTDKQGILQQQKDAVASSLEHVQDSTVTTSKRITDPEQEFQQGLCSCGLLNLFPSAIPQLSMQNYLSHHSKP